MATPPLLRRLPRRRFLSAQTTSQQQGMASPGPAPSPTSPDRDVDFLNRATHGFTRSEYLRLRQMGRAAWVREQVMPTSTDHPLVAQTLAGLPSLALARQPYYDTYLHTSPIAARETRQATFTRAVYSNWQLRERLVDFWHDHFSVSMNSAAAMRVGHREYDTHAIRAHVFGTFTEMLIASARSVSMLTYLDGKLNVRSGPNENYSREVMELHTLGVDGPYTEMDVTELARSLTGWAHVPLENAAAAGLFFFRAGEHDNGPKVVLGQTIPAGGGESDGLQALDLLSRHPSTVDFVSRKLVRRFVSENAPDAAVELVKAAWDQSGGDLRAVTVALFSDEVANLAEPWKHPKVKRPFQFVAGLLRATGIETSDEWRGTAARLPAMGQGLFGWPAPNGYPDSSAAWSGDVYSRWNFAADFARGAVNGTIFPNSELIRILDGQPITRLARHLDELLTGGRGRKSSIQEIQSWIDGRPSFNASDFRDVLGMVASSPEFLQA